MIGYYLEYLQSLMYYYWNHPKGVDGAPLRSWDAWIDHTDAVMNNGGDFPF